MAMDQGEMDTFRRLVDEARFMSDTFIKWMRSPSDDMFWKTASPDEVKAMQEDTDAEGKVNCPLM